MLAQVIALALTAQVMVAQDDAALGVVEFAVLQSDDACIVLASDWSLRRVELATGITTAFAVEHIDGYDDPVTMQVIDEERIATWASWGPFFVRDAVSLEPLHRIDLPPEDKILCVSSSGMRIATGSRDGQLTVRTAARPLEPLAIPGVSGSIDSRQGDGWLVALSPDGSRLAVVQSLRLYLLDAATAELLEELPLRDIPPGRQASLDGLTFYDAEHVLVSGTESDLDWDVSSAGVDVIELPEGKRIARLEPAGFPWPDVVVGLRCDPSIGAVSFSIDRAGFVVRFGAEDWKERWHLDYGGGWQARLRVRHTRGSDRIYVSGMYDHYARVLDAATGESLPGTAPLGFQLAGTSNNCFVVCVRERALHVFDGDTFEELYTRTELADGQSRLVRAER